MTKLASVGTSYSIPSYFLLSLCPLPQYTVVPHQPIRLSRKDPIPHNAMHMLSTIFPHSHVACSGLKLPLSGAISGCHCAMNVIAAPHIFVSTLRFPLFYTTPPVFFSLFLFSLKTGVRRLQLRRTPHYVAACEGKDQGTAPDSVGEHIG